MALYLTEGFQQIMTPFKSGTPQILLGIMSPIDEAQRLRLPTPTGPAMARVLRRLPPLRRLNDQSSSTAVRCDKTVGNVS